MGEAAGGRGNRLRLAWADLSLRAKGLIVVAIPVAALLVVPPVYYLSLSRAQQADEVVAATFEVDDQIEDVRALSLESLLRLRGYLLTGSSEALDLYSEVVDEIPSALDALAPSDPEQIRAAEELRTPVERFLEELERLRTSYPVAGLASAQDRSLVLQIKAAHDDVLERLDAMRVRQDHLLESRRALAQRADRIGTIIVAVTVPVGLAVGFLATLLFAAGVSTRIRRIEENARRLAEQTPLLPIGQGRDEIGQLGTALQDAAELLAERQDSLAVSEARYRTLARNFPSGAIVLFDHDLRYTLAEGQALQTVGLTKDAVEGKTVWEVLPPETAPAAAEQYRAALLGEPSTLERAFGDRMFLVQTVPVVSDTGEVVAGMLVAIDITARRQAEDEARAAEAFLDSIVENLPNMVFVKDAEELRFVRFNRAGEELLGHPREALIGRNDYDLFPTDEADFFTEKDRETLRSRGMLDILEEPIVTASGETRFLHTKKIPVLDESGEPRYLLGISEDITDRKRLDRELREAKDEAERANRAKDEFLSRMSHELRTPMNAVLGFAQLLDMDDITDEQRDEVQQILKGGRHLLVLIDEVLDISRIAAGNLSVSQEPVPLTATLREVVDLAGPLASERAVALRLEDANGLHVLADRQRLKQVLLNLVSNGIKYNREGGEVHVSWEKAEGGNLRIIVADTGPGIPADKLERLFRPFDRLGAEATGVEGTGLGLALTKGLVEAMGGSISVDSEQGHGTAFGVRLARAEPPLDSLQREDREVKPPPDAWGGSRTVLHIEDNLSNLALVERVLEDRHNVRLVSAMQGQLGLDLARLHHPDMVLLDVHLPDMSGEDVLSALREDPVTSGIPVVVLSADAMHARSKKLLAKGAREYLTKPLDVRRFLEVVDGILDGSEA